MSVAEGLNKFGFAFLQKIIDKADFAPESTPAKNVLISPISVALSLSMLIEGAEGETKRQLLNTLQFPENYLTELKATVDKISRVLNASNSIWVQHTYKLAEQYAATIKQYFSNFEAKNIDFTDPQAVNEINGWIEAKTDGLLRNALNPSPSTILLLVCTIPHMKRVLTHFKVNALVFKGVWQTSFDPKYTQRLQFNGFGFKSTPEFMINMNGDFSFHNGPNFKALELPYSSHSQIKHLVDKKFADHPTDISIASGARATSMFVILPKPPVAANWTKLCNANFLTDFVSQIVPEMTKTTKEVVVYIPKFKFRDEYSLKEHLEAMGATDMWDSGSANFSKMTASSSKLFATSAIHKTYIEIDEEGTKAAAISAIEMGYGSAGDGDDPEEFKAEHPFIYLIYHHATKQVLFMGYVLRPSFQPVP